MSWFVMYYQNHHLIGLPSFETHPIFSESSLKALEPNTSSWSVAGTMGLEYMGRCCPTELWPGWGVCGRISGSSSHPRHQVLSRERVSNPKNWPESCVPLSIPCWAKYVRDEKIFSPLKHIYSQIIYILLGNCLGLLRICVQAIY